MTVTYYGSSSRHQGCSDVGKLLCNLLQTGKLLDSCLLTYVLDLMCCAVRDEQPVRIRLTDVNDELPVFRNVPRPFLTTVATDALPGTSVYHLLAQDDDEDSVVRYTLESGQSVLLE